MPDRVRDGTLLPSVDGQLGELTGFRGLTPPAAKRGSQKENDMATATTERPATTERSGTTQHYRAYAPKPFTRAERDSVTILFGGLHWRVERILQAVLESGGHKAPGPPAATKDDLLTGREAAHIGQGCPTSFTTRQPGHFTTTQAHAPNPAG